MAASVDIVRITGASGSQVETVITSTNTRANAEDSPTSTTGNSILVPSSAGTNYSYWVTTRLKVNTITSGTVDNVKWFTDGSNNFGTGVTCSVGQSTAYVQANGTPGTSGNLVQTGAPASHATYTLGNANAFTYVTGSPLSVTGTTTTTGQFGNYVIYQIGVDQTAASGATAQETFTWRYDDTSS